MEKALEWAEKHQNDKDYDETLFVPNPVLTLHEAKKCYTKKVLTKEMEAEIAKKEEALNKIREKWDYEARLDQPSAIMEFMDQHLSLEELLEKKENGEWEEMEKTMANYAKGIEGTKVRKKRPIEIREEDVSYKPVREFDKEMYQHEPAEFYRIRHKNMGYEIRYDQILYEDAKLKPYELNKELIVIPEDSGDEMEALAVYGKDVKESSEAFSKLYIQMVVELIEALLKDPNDPNLEELPSDKYEEDFYKFMAEVRSSYAFLRTIGYRVELCSHGYEKLCELCKEYKEEYTIKRDKTDPEMLKKALKILKKK